VVMFKWPVAAFRRMGVALPPSVAAAGSAADKVAAAEALLQQPGHALDALRIFDEAIDAFWMTLPRTFRESAFASTVTGYGQYVPRPDAVFHPGEEALVYLALAGYVSRRITTGYRVDFSTAIQIRMPSGAVIARNDDYG